MTTFSVNCFSFTLGGFGYITNKAPVRLEQVNAKNIYDACLENNCDCVHLIGPQVIANKIKQELLEIYGYSNVSILGEEKNA